MNVDVVRETLLESLPGIHGNLLGLAVAIYASYAVYAFEKLEAARSSLQHLVNELRGLCTSTDFYGASGREFLGANGVLDWHGKVFSFFQVFREGEVTYIPSLDERKLGHSVPPADRPAAALHVVKQLMAILNQFCSTYPLNGNWVHFGSISDVIAKKKDSAFDSRRVAELEINLIYAMKPWEDSEGSVRSIARVAEREYLRQRRDKLLAAFEQSHDPSREGMSADELLQQRERFVARHTGPSLAFEAILEYQFNRLRTIQSDYLPNIRAYVGTLTLYEKKFEIRRMSLGVMRFLAFVFMTGIFIPPVVSLLFEQFHREVPILVDYLFVFLSLTPYALAGGWVYDRLKAQPYE